MSRPATPPPLAPALRRFSSRSRARAESRISPSMLARPPRPPISFLGHVHQATSRSQPRPPFMKAAVHLDQLAKVLAPFSSLPISPRFSRAAPQFLLHHPATHRCHRQLDPVFAAQVLLSRRRAESLTYRAGVFLPDQAHRLLRFIPIRISSYGPKHQPAAASFSYRFQIRLACR